MFDVITFGTATFDVFLKSSGLEINESATSKDICVRYGAKLEVNEIFFDYGGGGTNSAVTFARQGLNVGCAVQIGDDDFGKKILGNLEKERITTDFVNTKQNSFTDYSTILWASDGGRTVLVYRGKSRLELKDVTWEKLEAKWFYVSSLEGNLEVVEKLQSFRTSESQSKIMWNPGGRELAQREKVLSLLSGITVLNVNKEEMSELLAISHQPSTINDILLEAQKLPCEYIVITDDKNGAYLWDRNTSTWWHSGIFEDKPRVETLGAGDGFGSGLATGFMKELPLEECLYLAGANASSVVGQIGAKKGILKQSDLEDWPREKIKIEKLQVR